MIKDFKRGEVVTVTDYEIMFDDGHYNGFGFPCDKDGNPKIREDNDVAWENYEYCKANLDKFVRKGVVVPETWSYREPNTGTCECGKRIELENQYLGACECPNCGLWYNMFGQELNPPETWSSGDDW